MGPLFTQLFQYLKALILYGVYWLLDLLMMIINGIIVVIGALFSTVAAMFPPSSGLDLSLPSVFGTYANEICWFIPVGAMASCLTVYGVGILAYIGIKPILKFIRLS